MSRLIERRIRQLRRVYEQAGDVNVLLDLLGAENRAYVHQMAARRQACDLSQDLQREGDCVYLQVPLAACRRRAEYLRSLCEGVLGRPVDVQPVSGEESEGACRIALRLQLPLGPPATCGCLRGEDEETRRQPSVLPQSPGV